MNPISRSRSLPPRMPNERSNERSKPELPNSRPHKRHKPNSFTSNTVNEARKKVFESSNLLNEVVSFLDFKHREVTRSTCKYIRNEIGLTKSLESRAVDVWSAKCQGLLDIWDLGTRAITKLSSLKFHLRWFAWIKVNTTQMHFSVHYFESNLNQSLPFVVYDREQVEGDERDTNILVVYNKTEDSDSMQAVRYGFEVYDAWATDPSFYYDSKKVPIVGTDAWQNTISNKPYSGCARMYRTTARLQNNVESLDKVPSLLSTEKAILNILRESTYINILPIVAWSPVARDSDFFVMVHLDNTTPLHQTTFTEPYQLVRTVVSLFHVVYHLHKMNIAARNGLCYRDVQINDNSWAFLANYTALALVEDGSESLFAEDILNLGKLLAYIVFNCKGAQVSQVASSHRFAFMKPLIMNMVGPANQRHNIHSASFGFLALVNKHFKLNGHHPNFTELWAVLNSPPLNL